MIEDLTEDEKWLVAMAMGSYKSWLENIHPRGFKHPRVVCAYKGAVRKLGLRGDMNSQEKFVVIVRQDANEGA